MGTRRGICITTCSACLHRPPFSRSHPESTGSRLQFEYLRKSASAFQSKRAPVLPSATSPRVNRFGTSPRYKSALPASEAALPSFQSRAGSSEACHLVYVGLPERPAGSNLVAPVPRCNRRHGAYRSFPVVAGKRCKGFSLQGIEAGTSTTIRNSRPALRAQCVCAILPEEL